MSLRVIKLQDQAKGQFNGGSILENKPIGFPQDGGKLKPYSNLFYWAHAWTPGEKSLIGEHPHQGFEIMSFVLKGSIEHYDNKNREWRRLNEGDAQIIRSGSGITHAEMVNEQSEFFQIWVDPNLRDTLSMEPSYDDYTSGSFPVIQGNGRKTKIYSGDGSPLAMHTKGVDIHEVTFNPGEHEFQLDKDRLYSIYVLDGDINIDEQQFSTKDFLIVEDKKTLNIQSEKAFRLFVIANPNKLEYRTYAEQIRY
jgi:redox-sensitive bicupin YhaK (pirin superfamily)